MTFEGPWGSRFAARIDFSISLYVPSPGVDIPDAITEMVSISTEHRENLSGTFGEVSLSCMPGSSATALIADWVAETKRLGEEKLHRFRLNANLKARFLIDSLDRLSLGATELEIRLRDLAAEYIRTQV